MKVKAAFSQNVVDRMYLLTGMWEFPLRPSGKRAWRRKISWWYRTRTCFVVTDRPYILLRYYKWRLCQVVTFWSLQYDNMSISCQYQILLSELSGACV